VGWEKITDVAGGVGAYLFFSQGRALYRGVFSGETTAPSLEGSSLSTGLLPTGRAAPVLWSGLIGFNDPSAGSPTETLLRLLLPLNGRVQRNSRSNGQETCPEFQS
jgi:hypothetical protein